MTTDQLSATFSALADPTRRAILARLSQGEVTVGELAAPFDMTLAAVSKHLRVLERAGLVTRGRDAQFRPARLDATPLAAASEWIGDYARFWEDSIGALDHYLNALQQIRITAHDKENTHG
ncbi:metalloregulator ArsR/SmtB family transcription factor [Microbacterium deminutum]|uniref:Metalloregulator ArsR/SmtB family transcription factor n=1 Tax=Microbacterium deminutum TaxID=344164 RepID=A0ABN2QE04_9MICO